MKYKNHFIVCTLLQIEPASTMNTPKDASERRPIHASGIPGVAISVGSMNRVYGWSGSDDTRFCKGGYGNG
ncbi:protein of unknown function [Methanoculleus bourgensis]|uniref:Uncharacterized protein n=1 Tax=Methanoculleus bourgensis TaxID=83986 RepID=A0A0X3BIJ7_9EURY|nr:protein of unknown function [Methanoculleus bourgensis]